MCTAATYQTRDFYFGRTLDYEFSYPSEVTRMVDLTVGKIHGLWYNIIIAPSPP